MEIVILEGYTSNHGDLSWEAFEKLGNAVVYDRCPADQIVARSQGKEAIIINKAPITEAVLAQLPDLKYIGYLATGYNTVDLEAARKRGIPVCNAVGYSSASVAQHAIALLLALSNQVALHSDSVKAGDWTKGPDWSYRKSPLIELAGKNMGIVGLGNIGSQTAKIARSLGMNILAHNRNPRRDLPDVQWLSLEALFEQADVVSLHCPLTPENHQFVNSSLLSRMKSTAFFINTARGGLVDEAALANALNEGRLAGAGLDVLSTEPPAADNPLPGAKNCLITPHNAWASRESRQRLIQIAADNLAAFIQGTPKNVVNF